MGTCTQGRDSSGRSVGDNPGKVVGFAGWAEGIMTRSDLFETYFFVLVFVLASSHNGWTIFQPDLLVFISPDFPPSPDLVQLRSGFRQEPALRAKLFARQPEKEKLTLDSGHDICQTVYTRRLWTDYT